MAALTSIFNFQTELEALKTWFSSLNETERKTALHVLVEQVDLAQKFALVETVARNIEKQVDLPDARASHQTGKNAAIENDCGGNQVSSRKDSILQATPHQVLPFHQHLASPAAAICKVQQFSSISRPTSAPAVLRHAKTFQSSQQPPRTPFQLYHDNSKMHSSPAYHRMQSQQFPNAIDPISHTEAMKNLCVLISEPLPSPALPSCRPAPRPPRKRLGLPYDDSNPEWLCQWLKCLRLHKYEPNLKGLKRAELLELNDEELFARGIDTLGARTKLISAFREAKEQRWKREGAGTGVKGDSSRKGG